MDPAHLIPKLILRKRWRIHESKLNDPRIIVPACRNHHHSFDQGFIPVPLDAIPEEAFDYAEEIGHPDFFLTDFRFAKTRA